MVILLVKMVILLVKMVILLVKMVILLVIFLVNGNSIVNFILGCWFCSRSCNSLMSQHGYFQNMKQSSKYLFHDLVKSSFMSLLYFLPIISYMFSSKYARVRVAYVGAIFVPKAVPSIWIYKYIYMYIHIYSSIQSIRSKE